MDLLEAQKSSGGWFRLARGATFMLVGVAFILLMISLTQRPAPGPSGAHAAKHSSAAGQPLLSPAG